MKLQLPNPHLDLPKWPEHTLKIWEDLAVKLERTARSAGRSDYFEEAKKILRLLSQQKQFKKIIAKLGSRLYARALVSLWLEEPGERKNSLVEKMLDGLVERQQRLSVLTLTCLIKLYFQEFDYLDDTDRREDAIREKLARVIEGQLQMRSARQRSQKHTNLLRAPEEVLSLNAPKKIAAAARKQDLNLHEYMEKRGWNIAAQGRFLDVCQGIYYLDTLRHIPAGSHDSVLSELKNPEINKVPYEGERRIGHAALEIVIDRSGDQASDEWRNFIIDVAGDPRITGSKAFTYWWQPLGQERINKVRGWLSKVDIKVFLKALEDWSQSQSNEDIRRMLPARKRFIQGLYENGWLRKSRLILGANVAQALRSRLDRDVRRIHFTHFDKSDTAIIVMDCGEFYIVEGSHSFKIWVYLAPPANDMLFNYSVRSFTYHELIKKLPAAYEEEYPDLEYLAKRHYPNVGWQHGVLSFLGRHGIRVSPEDVLTPRDYDKMLRKYSMPAVSSWKRKTPRYQWPGNNAR